MEIMSVEAFEAYDVLARNHRIETAIHEGVGADKRGEYASSEGVLAEIRDGHGL